MKKNIKVGDKIRCQVTKKKGEVVEAYVSNLSSSDESIHTDETFVHKVKDEDGNIFEIKSNETQKIIGGTARARLREIMGNYVPKVIPPDPIEFTLGLMVGDAIYHDFLPTLSTDMLQTRHVIKVSDEETLEHTKLHDAWWEKVSLHWSNKDEERHAKSKVEWDALKKYEHMLSKKYMPHVLRCYVHKINLEGIKDIEVFKKGIGAALWDCDLCAYHTDNANIEVSQEEYNTIIKLKLDLHEIA